ncbi:MAG: isoprenylcysteine carboxylmethyltransferase family protein [Sphingomonadales bacterium]|nr:MAG: isoprenylcysteine carboxylmethyltransferase family protein [Sphingomonadales bacterium]TNF02985.1 MAG: isoprenylcysteine carboxylmethyltransferase family protein [Sphingomonadales bacterium]
MFWKADADSPRVLVPPPIIFLTFFLAGWGIDWLTGWSLPLSQTLRFGGTAVLIGASGLILIAALWCFLRERVNPEPWKTTRAIIERGIYAYSRNPIYLGMALLYVGVAVLLASPGALILLPPVLLVIRIQVIAREERYLEGKFGDPYRAYQAKVRRWI